MRSELQDVETGERGYMLTSDERFLAPFNDAVDQVGKGIQKLRELTKDNPNQQKRLDNIKPLAEEKISYSKKAFEFLKEKGRQHSGEWNYVHGKEIMDKFRVIASEMIKEEEDLLKKREVDAKETVSSTKTTIITSAVLSLVCMIFITVLLTRNISSPLKDLTDVAENISNGDISAGLKPGNRGDEVGDLTKSFAAMIQYLQEMTGVSKRIAGGDLTVTVKPLSDRDLLGNAFVDMIESLRKMNQEISEGVNVLVPSVGEILASTTELASVSAETSTSVSETTATVEEVKQTARMASEKSKNVSDSTQQAVLVAQQGQAAVTETVNGINLIKQHMESVAESIVKLSEQNQTIGEIISTVNDLAQQSNLLAVNAAIEASKAGEQGKGFAVVAQEVKSLAEQSKQATVQVRTILNDIQKATASAVMTTEQVSKAVDASVTQAVESGDSIARLTESVSEASNALMQIVASSQQQLVGMDQIALAMENIRQAAQQNAAGTKQVEQSAHGLNELGQKLKEMVARYRV
jgi:methyl-accepting chemotaxis protein